MPFTVAFCIILANFHLFYSLLKDSSGLKTYRNQWEVQIIFCFFQIIIKILKIYVITISYNCCLQLFIKNMFDNKGIKTCFTTLFKAFKDIVLFCKDLKRR